MKMTKVKSQMDTLKIDGHKFANGEEQAEFNKLMAEACTSAELDACHGISNQGFHYLGSAKILASIGQGFAEAMAEVMRPPAQAGGQA